MKPIRELLLGAHGFLSLDSKVTLTSEADTWFDFRCLFESVSSGELDGRRTKLRIKTSSCHSKQTIV
jgi:hypothetical protein